MYAKSVSRTRIPVTLVYLETVRLLAAHELSLWTAYCARVNKEKVGGANTPLGNRASLAHASHVWLQLLIFLQ